MDPSEMTHLLLILGCFYRRGTTKRDGARASVECWDTRTADSHSSDGEAAGKG
ncbi:hypothetical protein VTK73DRAFT_5650 [Phialemonium thermophilum]|uniref:Uncharacterized protein n=1 Tax=Phialemonium thermophilum TaxID=223376 RepID=A0ABR3V1H1_9PEZI